MTNEEYRNLKLQAHQQLVEDYHWLMSQSPAQYTWRCPQRWLIELVYNANQDRPVDEWQRDIPLTRLYRDFFTHIGTKPPNHPSTQLSKLRNLRFFYKKRAENKLLQCYTACFATPPFCHNNFITFADRLSISGIVIPTGAPI